METSEIIFSIEWYVKSKNLALKNALAIRCPMDEGVLEEHRQYYSQYLSSVLSMTELLCDKASPSCDEFKEKLYSTLGEKYYDYLRELRNGVVHRGNNLTSTAHVVNDFPLILAPSPVTNRNGNKIYEAPEKYFLSIIKHLEVVIPPLMINHIKENGWHNVFLSRDEALEEHKQSIEESKAMPEWAKQLALQSMQKIDIQEMQRQQMDSALEAIGVTVELPKIA